MSKTLILPLKSWTISYVPAAKDKYSVIVYYDHEEISKLTPTRIYSLSESKHFKTLEKAIEYVNEIDSNDE